MRVLAVLLVASAAFALVAPCVAAAAAAPVSYKPPVDGPIVDTWRPPPEPWDPGNRGIDYAPGRGTPVKAAADGEVTFAGQVGGELHVVVLHPDGVRTSYSFLESIAVHRGDQVRQGQVIGTAGDDLHFGARVGDDYIDPRTLFDGPPHVFLVPDEVGKPGTEAQERSGLSRFLSGVNKVVVGGGRIVAGQVAGVVEEVRGVWEEASSLRVWPHAVGLINTVVAWWNQRSDCTLASVQPPPVPEPRVAVLVGGLGSSTDEDSLKAVDAPGMGYIDTVRLSYKGGTAEENPYTTHDTTQDLRTEAKHLRDLLAQVHREHPGAPVDIIAHSQGGIIARLALAYDHTPLDPAMPEVKHVVTLASPHQGADLATALTNLNHTLTGKATEWAVSEANVTGTDLRGTSVHQLAEGSELLAKLNERRLPDGVQLTSIGSRGDALVPGIHTKVAGGRNVIVDLPGFLSDHRNLPGSAQGRREVGLAVADLPPTCQTLTDMMADTVVSDAIATGEDMAGLAAWGGATWLEAAKPWLR